MDSWPGRFHPGQDDPDEYDRQATGALIEVCHPIIEPLIDRLRRHSFGFATMERVHADAIDVEVLYRQTIPAAGLGLAAGVQDEVLVDYLEAFALCQTLILNHVDRHLDLSSSITAGHSAVLLADVRTTACYAITVLYEGIRALPHSTSGARALATMSQTTSLIAQSMYDNYATRFSEAALTDPEAVLEDYRHPVRSRHLGSGFYSSSILGLYQFVDQPIPEQLPDLLKDLRRVRQRIDELADLHEDTVTGMVTYPVALLLAGPYGDEARKIIRAAWRRCRFLVEGRRDDALQATWTVREDERLRELSAELITLADGTGVLELCRDEADELCARVAEQIHRTFDSPAQAVMTTVLDLKRALLDRLSRARWLCPPVAHSLEQIRQAVVTTNCGT